MRDNIIRSLRKQILLSAIAGGGGHVAPSYSALEILWTLYGEGILKIHPQDPCWQERDRMILSKGHAALALYACLAYAGFFEQEELWTFAKPESRLGGEPMIGIPGVEMATGSLGHGLSYGVGTALGMKKKSADCVKSLAELKTADYSELFNLRCFEEALLLLVGDGECQEGSIWEAANTAAALALDNLTVILDWNNLQKMDFVDKIMGSPNWVMRWKSFGWQVIEVDGHDVDALCAAFRVPHEAGKPKIILAHTIKGYGVSVMENRVNWHYHIPNKRELKACMAELGISQEEIDYAKSLH